MFRGLSRGKPTHADRLERWLGGAEILAGISANMRDFYYPVAMSGVPGNVFAMPGGDFCGEITEGQHCSAYDRADIALKRYHRERRALIARHRIAASQGRGALGRMDQRQHAFGSLSAVIAAYSGGKGQYPIFQKTGVASNAIGNANDLWTRSGQPAAGAAGAAAPGGTIPTSASTGAINAYQNGVSSNSNHFLSAWANGSVVNNTLMLYDRLFAVAKTMNSTGTEAVTGVPTRYQSQTPGNVSFCGGNFLFPANPTTVLAATAHNWTVSQYTNQAGTTGQSVPSVAGVSACVVGGIDLAAGAGSWFMPLASGDYGIKALTQIQCSALVATGTIDFVMGHQLAFFPCPAANMICPVDGLNTAFNLQAVLDNACLAFLEMPKPATTATSYSGVITFLSE